MSMVPVYSPEIQRLHSKEKRLISDTISNVDSNNFFTNRAIKLDQYLQASSVPAVLEILEWNSRHFDLRTTTSKDDHEIAEELHTKMLEEVDEYEEALDLHKDSLGIQDVRVPWYARDNAQLLWKVGGEIADAGIFAIGLLEVLKFDARKILSIAELPPERKAWYQKPLLQANGILDSNMASAAVQVIDNVGYHADKIGVPIRSVLFYKALLNEQHRSSALHVPLQLNGYSSTLRRSIGPLVWDSGKNRKVLDSQIPALSQSWVGPTVIETFIEKSEYEFGYLPIDELVGMGKLHSYSDLYPEPQTRQKEILLWRSISK